MMINNAERIAQMTRRLEFALTVKQLTISDDSHLHVGHVGAKTGKGHFTLTIAADEFIGLSRVACHRLIYSALGELMEREIHALGIVVVG